MDGVPGLVRQGARYRSPEGWSSPETWAVARAAIAGGHAALLAVFAARCRELEAGGGPPARERLAEILRRFFAADPPAEDLDAALVRLALGRVDWGEVAAFVLEGRDMMAALEADEAEDGVVAAAAREPD